MQFRQGTNGYTGTSDTYIRADLPTSHFSDSTFVLANNHLPIAHALIRFDNLFGFGPGQVPPDATISSASLTLRTRNVGGVVWFHRLLVPWEETNNWNELSTSGPGLQADNVEMAATPDFAFAPSFPVPRVDAFDVTSTVQGWLAGTFPNYGWGITNHEPYGWESDSSQHATIRQRPMLEITFSAPPHSIEIVRHPASVTTNEGAAVVFTVIVTGTDPRYQWFRDGLPIAEATNSTYIIPVAFRQDAGSYHVAVSNEISGPVLSSNAFLAVIQSDPPSVACAYGTNDNTTIFVRFSQIVTNGNDAFNYLIEPALGGDPLFVTSAVYAEGGTEGPMVVLTLYSGTLLQPNVPYVLRVADVFNRFGDPIDANQTTPLSLYPATLFVIGEQQIWKYNDSGSDFSNSWREISFDDSSWPSGLPLFGFETAPLPEPLRTSLNRTNGSGSSILTYYFRTHFSHSGATGADVLQFRTVLDDAAAVYLNGAEIFRMRLPAGPLDYMTQGTGASVVDAVYEGPFTVCVTNLANGDNVLAVEVHQTSPNSGDLVFGMELSAMSPDPPLQLRIAPSVDGTEVILTWTGSVKLEQTSSLSPGGWSEVEGAIGAHRTPMTGMRFFRLREP